MMNAELECERRFLVHHSLLPSGYDDNESKYIIQGYLINTADITVRVRLVADKLSPDQEKLFNEGQIRELMTVPSLFNSAIMTIKTAYSYATREETEFSIPVHQGTAILETTDAFLCKRRSIIRVKGYAWEVDKYAAPLAPLMIAEIEIPPEELQFGLPLPYWCGKEVTDDASLSNASLAEKTKTIKS